MKIKAVLRQSRDKDSGLKPWFPGWLDARYGDHFAQISVDTTLKLKSAIKDVSRAMRKRCTSCQQTYETSDHILNCSGCGSKRVVGFVPDDIEELTKTMLMPKGVTDYEFVIGHADDGGWVKGSSEPGHAGSDNSLLTYVERYPQDWEVVVRSLGLTRQKSKHASAFLISDKPVSSFIPLVTVTGTQVTSFTAPAVEAVGGLKMDFLVVNSLKDIQDCIKIIQERTTGKQTAASIINDRRVPSHRMVPLPLPDEGFADIWDLPEDQAVFNSIVEGRTETVFQFNCLDAETEALTRRGWVKGFDLNVQDILLTKNPKNMRLEWQGVSELKVFPDYEGPLVEIKSRSFNSISTPDHRWMVTNGSKRVTETTSNNLSGSYSIHRTGLPPLIDSAMTEDEAELLGWFVTDGTYEKHKKCNQSRKKNAGIYALLTQSEKANPEKCDRIQKLILRLDTRKEVTSSVQKNGQRIWRLGGLLCSFLLRWAPERYISIDTLTHLGERCLSRLLESIVLGDGWKRKGGNGVSVCTGRKEQADAIQALFTLCGRLASVKWRDMSMYSPKSSKMKNVPISNGCWVITGMKSKTTQPRNKQITKTFRKEPVWCPMVPNTFFVARRHGQVFITGNTPGAVKWLTHFNYSDKSGAKSIKSVEDLAIFTALDRPGPLDVDVINPDWKGPKDSPDGKHNMLVEFARRVRGATGSPDVLPILEELVPETKGVLVYQEQVQYIYQKLTGCSGADAEEFRSAVSKKKKDKVDAAYPFFIEKAGVTIGTEAAEQLWRTIETWSQYGFNKAHAVCYSVIGYSCAWLKYHYPMEWWCSVNRNADKEEVNNKFWRYCGKFINLPDLKASKENWFIEGTKIRAPISLLHGIGEKAHHLLCSYAPYSGVYDLAEKLTAYRDLTAKKKTKTKKHPKTGAVTEFEAIDLGQCAVTRSTVYKMVVAGVMASCFPEGLGISRCLEIYDDSMIAAAIDKMNKAEDPLRKKAWKSAVAAYRKAAKESYPDLDSMAKYQVRKSVLPAYGTDLRPIVAQYSLPFIQVMDANKMHYSWTQGGHTTSDAVIGYEKLDAISAVKEIPGAGFRTAVLAYLEEKRTFKYGENKSKEAADLTLEIGGGKYNFVHWPKKNGQLPEEVKNLRTGTVIVASIVRNNPDRPFSIKKIDVIRAPFRTTEKEEADVEKD